LPEADFRLWDVCAASARLPASDPGHPGGQELHRFDVVWCFHVFPHLRDQAGALRRMASWLAPGGQFVVLHLAGSAALNAFHHQVGGAVGDDRLPALPEFEAMLEPAGLRRIRGEDRDDLFLLRAVRAS
jgi:SAM-dependent methyltransferase